MNKSRSYMTATALGSLTAAAALLVGLNAAQAQAPAPAAAPLSGAGSFPGSFIVPGTDTSLHVGGVVQTDIEYDFDRDDGSSSPSGYDNEYPAATNVEGAGVTVNSSGVGNQAGHVLRMTDLSTRPNIETRTPTAYGELKTYIELGFTWTQTIGSGGSAPGSTATYTFGNEYGAGRLQQAYGTLGPWLFGLANSNYADLDSWNDDLTVDAGGYMGPTILRETQVRYTFLLPNGMSDAVSIENYESGGMIATNLNGLSAAAAYPAIPGAPAFMFNNFDYGLGMRIPALVNTARIDGPWGHAAWHFALAQTRVQEEASATNALGLISAAGAAQGNTPAGYTFEKWGFQTSLTGHLNTVGSDKVTWFGSVGHGAGEFNSSLQELGTQWVEDLVCSPTAIANVGFGANIQSWECSAPWTYGGSAGYTHYWAPEWRSTIAGGYDRVSRPKAASLWAQPGTGAGQFGASSASDLGVIEKAHYSADVNLMWSPLPAVQFGLEYEWKRRIVQSGASGSENRLESQALFKF